MLLLDLMTIDELEEVLCSLRKELFGIAAIKGFSDKRAVEISKRLELYLNRYIELKNQKKH